MYIIYIVSHEVLIGEYVKPIKYTAQLALKLEHRQRLAIEALAETDELSLGEAARELLDEGIRVRGIEI